MVSVSAYRTRTIVSPTAVAISEAPTFQGRVLSPGATRPLPSRLLGLQVLAVADLEDVADAAELVHGAQHVGRRDQPGIHARAGLLDLRLEGPPQDGRDLGPRHPAE